MSRTLWMVAAVALLAQGLWACAPSIADVRIFHAKPPVPYRVLGMVSGNGPNEASAMQAVLQNAVEVGANGVIVQGQRQLGRQVIIRAEAISYQGPLPPPGAQAADPGAGAPLGAPPAAPPQGY
ncbi:MAG: hypothetical protein KAI47_17455 [Deltaproteobacteria bacterium]|nr:hypothetical protein [Deltaproteobacteria bacterium]